MLLEGLWRNWGLYFTARSEPEKVGSSDLEDVLQDLKWFQRFEEITEENQDGALAANRRVAKRRFLLILYARVLVFRVFLECASEIPGGITEDHKGRWLLIQVAPSTLFFLHSRSWWEDSSQPSNLS